MGDITVTAGFPAFFFDPQLSVGFVVAASLDASLDPEFEDFWDGSFTSSAASSGGGSGGPVFDADGNWVAIHVGGSADEALELSIQLPLRL